jgi:hypothetical protein
MKHTRVRHSRKRTQTRRGKTVKRGGDMWGMANSPPIYRIIPASSANKIEKDRFLTKKLAESILEKRKCDLKNAGLFGCPAACLKKDRRCFLKRVEKYLYYYDKAGNLYEELEANMPNKFLREAIAGSTFVNFSKNLNQV